MSASFSAEFVEKLGKKNTAKGVKIATEEDGILINVSVLVKYGCTIREVASAVQTAVTDAVSGGASAAAPGKKGRIFQT